MDRVRQMASEHEPVAQVADAAEVASQERPSGRRDRPRKPARLLGVGVLWWAIATSALCFLPLGLVAVAYGLRAIRAGERGDDAFAQRSWRVARRWVVATILVGLAIDLFILAILLLLGAFAS